MTDRSEHTTVVSDVTIGLDDDGSYLVDEADFGFQSDEFISNSHSPGNNH